MRENETGLGGFPPAHPDRKHASVLSEIGSILIVYGALVAVPCLVAIMR